MSDIFDISVTIATGFPVWPGDPPISLERFSRIEDGAGANVSALSMPVHCGTHMDAPFHFISGGATIEMLPLEVLIGPVQVVQIPESLWTITGEVIRAAGIRPGTERVLFKTRNSRYWASGAAEFRTDFTAVDEGGAKALVELGIRLVGIDYFSIAPYDQSVPTHKVLLGNGIVILETCDLSQVDPGVYTLYALPVKLGGADGAPVRAVLIR